MGNTEKCVDTFLLTVGSLYSLANIEHILGIIILVIQLVWIVAKLVIKIVNAIKHGEPIIIDEELLLLNQMKTDLENISKEEGDTEENGDL